MSGEDDDLGLCPGHDCDAQFHTIDQCNVFHPSGEVSCTRPVAHSGPHRYCSRDEHDVRTWPHDEGGSRLSGVGEDKRVTGASCVCCTGKEGSP